jgi:hypothetical protein
MPDSGGVDVRCVVRCDVRVRGFDRHARRRVCRRHGGEDQWGVQRGVAAGGCTSGSSSPSLVSGSSMDAAAPGSATAAWVRPTRRDRAACVRRGAVARGATTARPLMADRRGAVKEVGAWASSMSPGLLQKSDGCVVRVLLAHARRGTGRLCTAHALHRSPRARRDPMPRREARGRAGAGHGVHATGGGLHGCRRRRRRDGHDGDHTRVACARCRVRGAAPAARLGFPSPTSTGHHVPLRPRGDARALRQATQFVPNSPSVQRIGPWAPSLALRTSASPLARRSRGRCFPHRRVRRLTSAHGVGSVCPRLEALTAPNSG